MTKKVKVKFLETRVVKDGLEGTPDETKFEEGKTYSLEQSSAERWVRREVAELVVPGKARRTQSPPGADDAGATGESDADTGSDADGAGDGDADTGDDGDAGDGDDLLS